MVTAGTYAKSHHFADPERLTVLMRGLLACASAFEWHLEAWAVFSNHYHFIAHSPPDGASTLRPMLSRLHRRTALWINRLDRSPGRRVWHNFLETRLTHQSSYLARLHYVHANAVHHRLVHEASTYPWCSASWFERTARPAQVQTIYGMKTDRLNLDDSYMPAPPS